MINLDHNITIMNVFLIMSHGIMAIEAIYFYPRLKIRISGLLVAMIWVFNNDYMDYVLNKYPYYDFIEQRQRDSRLYCFLAKCFCTKFIL